MPEQPDLAFLNLAIYTDPERHTTQRYRRTDGRTDGQTTSWC